MTESKRLFPLTNAQRSIWQIVRFYPETRFVNLAATVRIKERVNRDLLAQAINIAIQNNDGIRTRLIDTGHEPKQYFAAYAKKHIDFIDFSYPGGNEDLPQWEVVRTREKFELLDSDLYDFAIIKIGEEEGAFFLKAHHITADLWSMTLLASQILQHYYQLKSGREVCVEQLPSYRDHVLAEQEINLSERFEKHRAYWNQAFSAVPEFTTFRRETVLNCTDAQRRTHAIPQTVTSLIEDFSSLNKVSPFCILFSALTVCIWRLTSKTDIVISTPVLNRSGVKEKNTMGMFINTVPLRVRVNPDMDFAAFTNAVNQDWKSVLKHQRYPYDLILKNYRETHGISSKLTDVSFSFQNAKFQVDDIDFAAKVVFNGEELNSLSVHVHDRQDLGSYTVDYDFLTNVFSATEIDTLHGFLLNLLRGALAGSPPKLSELQILSPEQEQNLLLQTNSAKPDYHLLGTVVSLFAQQVAINPGENAVIFENHAVTYQELSDRAVKLAGFLRSQGVIKDSIVGLIVDRSVEMIVAILAVLKAGGAYLPIDPTYPADRIDYMLQDSNCRLILTYIKGKSFNLVSAASQFDLKDQRLYELNSIDLPPGPAPEDIACVIYTSGSTGAPKGVMIEHKGLTNLIKSFSELLNPGKKTVLAISTVSFDMFFVETIFPLVTGMRVILANQQEATVPYLLLQLIDKYNVNFLQTTPSRMKLILSDTHGDKLSNLTEIIIGGESFPPQLSSELKAVTGARIFNGYGPTEATICSTIKCLSPGDPITIGKPIDNVQIYILDEDMRPVPIGTKGEIYIGGLGLARGYINNEGLTKERFVPNPFLPGNRMYKTGDIARWLSSGEIEYIGRNDNQVKIRGFRIELGEIEERLLQNSLIKEAVVICREDKANKRYLSAYVTTNGEVTALELREYLAHFLPDYMVPTHFVFLQCLPLTPNGKVDRLSLPEPESAGEEKPEYSAPRNAQERKLVELWQAVLEVPQVGIDDNIFALGGDSLSVLEILSGLFPDDWGLSAQDFYDYPTIRRLCQKTSGTMPKPAKRDVKLVSALDSVAMGRGQVSPEPGSNVLLTGATGFLGIHILYELLFATSGKIYCLIRGQDAGTRLYQLLKEYFPFLSSNLLDARLVAISGDLTQENFGLEEKDFVALAQGVNTVIHAAALVKHYGNYDEFYRLNVLASQEVINFCVNHGKRLKYISTISVSGNYLARVQQSTTFTENDLEIGQDNLNNVYVRSKFEAEKLITKAQEKGLDATVFRVGVLTGRYSDGQFQKNIEQNAFYRVLRSIILMEAVPLDIVGQHLEFTPVDSCAKAIVGIIRANEAGKPRFHLFNHKTIKLAEVIKVFAASGVHIKVLPRSSFNSLLASISTTNEGKDILSGIIIDPSLKSVFRSASGIQVDSAWSIGFLRQIGFEWPDIQADYLLKVLHHMQSRGFLKQISVVS